MHLLQLMNVLRTEEEEVLQLVLMILALLHCKDYHSYVSKDPIVDIITGWKYGGTVGGIFTMTDNDLTEEFATLGSRLLLLGSPALSILFGLS